MRYLLSLIVENKHGVLAKISQVIAGRGYNISTLSVAPSHNEDTSRMMITFDCEEKVIQQVVKQLNKLVDVIKVFLVEEENSIERELLLVKIHRKKDNEDAIFRLTQIYGAKIINVNQKYFSIELTSEPKVINNFIENIRSFGILDLLRTGPLAIN